MTLTQLQYLVALSKHQNFTAAAEHCFVTQPTLSMQVLKLEDELSLKLINRSTTPISLTPAGKKIIRQAKVILREADRIKDIANQEIDYVGGEFKLGVIPTIMPTLLPSFLSSLTKKYPEVKLVLKEINTSQIIRELHEGQIDAAIAATPLNEKKLIEIPLYYEPFVAYIPKKHNLSSKKFIDANDLKLSEVLLLQEGHCFRDGVINLCKAISTKEANSFSIESSSFETLIQLCDKGLGMTLLPYLHTSNLKKKQRQNLTAFSAPAPAREVSLIYHKSELKMKLIKALEKEIKTKIKGSVGLKEVEIISPLLK
ncbi:MAG: DNA-binding transcriptional regulator OxyR [Flavobacteriaceae bacterium]|nr:DNA-binding transcriptional regulator OxyR [Flavobacteriaceae bacterium]